MDKTRRKKVVNEARILNGLKSQANVVRFYNYFETRNHLWLIFEFCPGGDLYSLLEKDRPLDESTIRHFGVELMNGLGFLHSNGVIYADLKPKTVLLNEYNKLKLSDFGLARMTTDYVKPGADNGK